MFWYALPIRKGSLISLLYIDSCWVYHILRSLTSLLYVIHVCRGSFTSPLMHYILCFMWVRVLSSLLHVRHVYRGANFTLSSSQMYIACISLLLMYFSPLCWFFCFWQKGGEHCFVFTLTHLLMIDKKGKKDFLSLYMHIWVFAYIEFYAYDVMFIQNGENDFESLNKKGEKVFGKKDFWFMHISLTLFIHIYLFSFMHFIAISIYLLLCMS